MNPHCLLKLLMNYGFLFIMQIDIKIGLSETGILNGSCQGFLHMPQFLQNFWGSLKITWLSNQADNSLGSKIAAFQICWKGS